jgi:hypothetical protein
MNDEQKGQQLPPPSSPKLKKAIAAIQAILDVNDVAGVCIIYEPGFSEYAINLGPTWSVVGINDDKKLRITPPLEDPENPNASKAKIAETVNMLANLRIGCTRLMMTLNGAEQATRNQFGIKPPPAPIINTKGFRTPPKNGRKF